MENTLFGIPLPILGFICLGFAVPWFFVWPIPNPNDPPRPAWRHFVLRWFHSLTWISLAMACFVASPETAWLSGALGILAVILFITFIATIVIDRQAA